MTGPLNNNKNESIKVIWGTRDQEAVTAPTLRGQRREWYYWRAESRELWKVWSLEGSSRYQRKTWGGEERNAPSSASSCLLWGTCWPRPLGGTSWGFRWCGPEGHRAREGWAGGMCSREQRVQTYMIFKSILSIISLCGGGRTFLQCCRVDSGPPVPSPARSQLALFLRRTPNTCRAQGQVQTEAHVLSVDTEVPDQGRLFIRDALSSYLDRYALS